LDRNKKTNPGAEPLQEESIREAIIFGRKNLLPVQLLPEDSAHRPKRECYTLP
jgi:hypothetical protein